jgi:hypothetical protein
MIYITSIKTGYVEKPIFNNHPYQTGKGRRGWEMGWERVVKLYYKVAILRVSSIGAMVYSGLGQDGCKGCLRNYCLALLNTNSLWLAS